MNNTSTHHGELEHKAFLFADKAHSDMSQTRKFSNLPYIVHPIGAANAIKKAAICTPEMVAACYLHDVVEDTNVSIQEIKELFGDSIASLVSMVTNPEVPEGCTIEERYAIYKEHISKASPEGKTVKLADIVDNLSSLHTAPEDFKMRYAKQKASMLEVLTDGDPTLWAMADQLIQKNLNVLT